MSILNEQKKEKDASFKKSAFHLNSRISLKRSYSEGFNELHKMLFFLLDQWEKMRSHKKPSLYLTFEMDPSEERKAIEIKKIEYLSFQGGSHIEVKLKKGWPAAGQAHLYYQMQNYEKQNKLCLQNAFIDFSDEKLSFHNHAQHRDTFMKQNEDTSPSINPPLFSKNSFKEGGSLAVLKDEVQKKGDQHRSPIPIYGHWQLYDHFTKGIFSFPKHWKQQNVFCSKLQANLDEKGFMQVQAFFQYEGQKFHLCNIGQEASQLFKVFNQGLCVFKKSVYSNPGILSLCRHRGIAYFIFMKYGEFYIEKNKPKEDKKYLKLILEEFLEKLEHKYKDKLNEKYTLQEVNFCAKAFLNYLYDLQEKKLPLYFKETELSVENYYQLLLKFIYYVLSANFQEKNILNSCFDFYGNWHEKIQDNMLFYPDSYKEEDPSKADSYLCPYTFKKDFILSTMQQFSNNPMKDIEVLMHNKQIYALNEKEFTSEFEIQTNSKVEEGRSEQKINWFELHPRVFFNGKEIPLDKIKSTKHKNFIEMNGKFYFLHPKHLIFLKYLKPFWEMEGDKGKFIKKRREKKNIYILPKSQSLEMLVLRANGLSIRGDENWQKICEFYDGMDKKRKLRDLPNTLVMELKKYQHYGVNWIYDLYHLQLGAILADDMGLGKTPQTLCCMEMLRVENKMKHCLIVVPTSLTYNWQSEIAKFTPKMPNIIFNSKEKNQLLPVF